MRARDNPFRTERILQVRYRLQGITWAELVGRCEILGYRAALVGPQGSGKTTLLEDLEPRLRERGFGTPFLRLNAEQRKVNPDFVNPLFDRLTANDILLVDGAEQMHPLAWRWFQWRTRRLAGLLITTHRGGRLPTLWECRTSSALLAGIAAELLAVRTETLGERADALFRRHGGDLRHALRDWYNLVAEEREN